MKQLSEFYSDDQSKKAIVYLNDEIPYVEFYKDNTQIGQQGFPDHTLAYAEEAAENYVAGILKIG